MNIALIPAKSFSRRIPNKNMMDFCDKPLVCWSVEQALNSKLIDFVSISTNSHEIASLYPWYGDGKFKSLLRPSELCTDTTTQEEVIAHAIDTLQLKDDDNIVLLQPTSPLRLPGDIDGCIKAEAFSVTLEDDMFLWHKELPLNFYFHGRELFDRATYRENGSIYFVNVGYWRGRKYPNRYMQYNINHYVMKKWQQFEIDEPDDIPIVEFMMKKYILKEAQ